MHKSKDQLYEEIKDLLSKKEFEKEISKIKEENDDLFDDETAALFIVDKLGRNKENICNISDIEPAAPEHDR